MKTNTKFSNWVGGGPKISLLLYTPLASVSKSSYIFHWIKSSSLRGESITDKSLDGFLRPLTRALGGKGAKTKCALAHPLCESKSQQIWLIRSNSLKGDSITEKWTDTLEESVGISRYVSGTLCLQNSCDSMLKLVAYTQTETIDVMPSIYALNLQEKGS